MRVAAPRRRGGPVPGSGPAATGPAPAGFAAALAVTVTLAAAGLLLLMAVVLLLVHPGGGGSLASTVIIQNQRAKTVLYLAAFLVVLPAALYAGPRLADLIASGADPRAVPGLAATAVASFALMLILVRLSAHLPWGDGLGTLLAGDALWLALAVVALVAAVRRRRRPPVSGRRRSPALLPATQATPTLAGLLVLGVLFCTTRIGGLSGLALGLGALAAIGILTVAGLAARRGVALPRAGARAGYGLDGLAVLVLLFAAVDVVVYSASAGVPSAYFPPGVIQFQQDWILGPTNQLLAGGAVLVNVPATQYGVGLLYFLAAWFHLAPIGYGTFGLLDGVLTALVYIAAYAVLRIAGVGRLLATGSIALGVAVMLYNLPYSVGALPEEGPLRFGLPVAVVLVEVVGARWPARARAARVLALITLGISAIWALEAFAYTALTFAAIIVVAAWLRGPETSPTRPGWLLRQAGLAVAAILCAHLILVAGTVAAVGRLPDYTQYLAYLRALLLGGHEGSITYGFANWSPAVLVAAAELASAAALVLVPRRAPALARAHPAALVAVTGSTAYAIACFSYIDNRSSTYLLLYTSLPLLTAGVVWLGLLLREGSPRVRLPGLALALGASVLMVSAAWPAIGPRFSRTALAHAHPGGGLGAALARLWHGPPLDPRAPEGVRLVKRFLPGRRALILLPAASDLGIEVALRAQRASPLFIGDPSQDVFVTSVWLPRVRAELARLAPGTRALVDQTALRDVRILRRRGPGYVLRHPLAGHSAQLDWVLHGLDVRFHLRPVRTAASGFVVVALEPRR